MVFLTKILNFAKPKRFLRKYQRSGFTDSLRIYVRGGSGGNGLPKFGGIGGHGGDVIAVAKESITLDDVKKFNNKSKRFVAPNGKNSSHNFILGPPGDSTVIEVPTGITAYTDEGRKLGELNQEGDQVVLAKGGSGGHPKNGYHGIKGEARSVKLDLKLIADVGFVGFPNAGKSTLLKAISQANPKIASYPFTTIKPNIGIINYKDLRQISVADLPGLIEGAHANRGMGHEFLRHVERTKLLLLMVDINGFQLSPQYPHRSCLDTVVLLNKELELYNPELLLKPTIIVVNKMDSILAYKKFMEIREQILDISGIFLDYPEECRPEKALEFDEIIAISAIQGGEDIELVKNKVRSILDVQAEIEQEKDLEQNAELARNIKESLQERGPRLV